MQSEYLKKDNNFDPEALNAFDVNIEELISEFQKSLEDPSVEYETFPIEVEGNPIETAKRLREYDKFTKEYVQVLVEAMRTLGSTVKPIRFINFVQNWRKENDDAEVSGNTPLSLAIEKIAHFLVVCFEKLLAKEFTTRQSGDEYDQFVAMLNQQRLKVLKQNIDSMISEVVAEAYKIMEDAEKRRAAIETSGI